MMYDVSAAMTWAVKPTISAVVMSYFPMASPIDPS
jgi:hypothetical protein